MKDPARNRAEASPTGVLAHYVAVASYDHLAAEIIAAAKGYILDSIGNAIGGSLAEPGRTIQELFQGLGGSEEATVLASGKKLPSLHASYVNSFLANTLDFDDTYAGRGAGHPGATVVPPALAVGERVQATGKDLINAVVVGYEVSLRICQAINPSPERMRQVLGLSTWQVFGAVAAASKLLKLDADGVATAFGLAGPCASVPFGWKFGLAREDRPYSWIKNNYGWASMGGILATDLAARGFVGNKHFLDGERGFWIMAGSDRCDFGRMTAGLGEDYWITSVSHKPYACCRWSHTTLDAVSEIMAAQTIDPSEVQEIQVRAFYEAVVSLGVWRPQYVVDAMFSLPHLIALVLLGKSPSRGLDEADLSDSEVRALEAKVARLELDPEADRAYGMNQHEMPSTVTITMRNGRSYTARVVHPRGDPENPLSDEELQAKFRQLVVPLLGPEKTERIVKRVRELESLDDVSKLML